MMKTVLMGGLLLLTALTVAPAAHADPVSCPDLNPLDDGFAYCHYETPRGRGCVYVDLGSGKHCT